MKCFFCGESFKSIGVHWARSPECDYPSLSDTRREMLVGCLMGDGCIGNKDRKNQHMKVEWSSKKQCQWLDNEFGWLSTGVSLGKTAEESAEQVGRRGIGGEEYVSKSENYSDSYEVRTRSHPEITKLASWYSTGEKVWPNEIDLTSTTLLLWFVGDGCYHNSGSARRISIGMNNEKKNTEKVYKYFDRKNLPRPNSDDDGKAPLWTVSGSKQLFEHMSKTPIQFPPGGFEYKFPKEYGGTGKSMEDV